jgi:DNA polymerase-3 subunit beta
MTVPAHQLATLIKDMPGGDLQVETTENYSLKIFQGEAKYRLHGLDPEQFPNLPDAEEGVGYVEIPSSTLKEMIKRVIFSVSTDDLQYHLSSVLWENLDGLALRMVAPNGHRLTAYETGDILDSGFIGRLVIMASPVGLLLRVWPPGIVNRVKNDTRTIVR